MTKEECLKRALTARKHMERARLRMEDIAARLGGADFLYKAAVRDFRFWQDRVVEWEMRAGRTPPHPRAAPNNGGGIPFFLLKQAV